MMRLGAPGRVARPQQQPQPQQRKGSGEQVRVRVAVRVRPLLGDEGAPGADGAPPVCVTGVTARSVSLWNHRAGGETLSFKFDACYDEACTQARLFDTEVKPLLQHALEGRNACCFAYGPTGAGKTHTMQGNDDQPGIIPRTVSALLAMMAQARAEDPAGSVALSVAYLEIYNEKVFDLLEVKEGDLPIREDQHRNILIPGLAEVPVVDAAGFAAAFREALGNRRVAATKLNARSSRSHAVMQLRVRRRDGATGRAWLGKVHLIDLAGSEDNRRTANVGVRLKESGAINKSLFVLGKVVDALNQGHHRIPYRDSKLTRLLQDSLGGDSHACMVANVAPGTPMYQDTLNCLNFASKSRNVVNQAYTTTLVEPAPAAAQQVRARSHTVSGTTRPAPPRAPRPQPPQQRRRASSTVSASARPGDEASMERRLLERLEGKLARRQAQANKTAAADLLRQQKELQVRWDRLEAVEKRLAARSKPRQRAQGQGKREARETSAAVAAGAMTPGSKRTMAKAYIQQAKALRKHGDAASALEHFRLAAKLVPDSDKLQCKVDEVSAELRQQQRAAPAQHTRPPPSSGVRRKPLQVLNGRPLARQGTAKKKRKPAATQAAPHKARRLDAAAHGGGKRRRSDADDPDYLPDDDDDGDGEGEGDAGRGGRQHAAPPPAAAAAEPAIQLNASLKRSLEADILGLLNGGGLKELMALNGIGKKRAQTILDFRGQRGPFNQVADLKFVGFGDKLVSNLLKGNVMTMIQFQ